jgi:hypothetical protein
LTVNPAGACFKQGVLWCELGRDELLEQLFSLFLVTVSHMGRKQAKSVHESFLLPPVLYSWQVLDDQIEVVRKVIWNFDLAGLADIANCLDEGLIHSLYVPPVAVVDLQTDILYFVILPDLKLLVADEQQRKCKFKQNRSKMRLTNCGVEFLAFNCSGDKSERGS